MSYDTERVIEEEERKPKPFDWDGWLDEVYMQMIPIGIRAEHMDRRGPKVAKSRIYWNDTD